MKKWLEDNWFTRLKELFESSRVEAFQLEEARGSSDSKPLTIENLTKFPRIFRELLNLQHTPEVSGDDTDLTQAVGLPPYFRTLKVDLSKIAKSAIVCREGCDDIASVFLDNLVEIAIDLYLQAVSDYIEYRRLWTLDKLKDNLGYRRLKKQEKAIEARYPYGNPERKEKELSELRGDYAELLSKLEFTDSANKKIATLPVDPADKDYYTSFVKMMLFRDVDKDIEAARKDIVAEAKIVNIGDDKVYAHRSTYGDDSEYYTALFDVRDNEICINIACDWIQKNRFLTDMKDAPEAREKYKCSSFVEGLPNIKEGLSKPIVTEKSYYSEKKVRDFQQNIYPLVAKEFRPLSEKNYRLLLSNAARGSHQVYSAYADAPAVETMRVATFTGDQFKKIIGCVFKAAPDSQGNPTLVIENERGGMYGYDETVKRWNSLLRADVLYLIEDPSRRYSDGSVAKQYLSVQVKAGNAFIGSGKLSISALENLNIYYATSRPTAKNFCMQLIKALVRGGYLLVNGGTNEWGFLSRDPLIEITGRHETLTERHIYVDVDNVHRLKLRFAKTGAKKAADESDIRLEFRRASED